MATSVMWVHHNLMEKDLEYFDLGDESSTFPYETYDHYTECSPLAEFREEIRGLLVAQGALYLRTFVQD